MKKFIQQYRKALEGKLYLIWDQRERRYLVTHKRHWLDWPGCSLIKKFT